MIPETAGVAPWRALAPNEMWWLAGLLEAEGSFMRPSPCNPTMPKVRIEMTDPEPIRRCADWWAVKASTIRPRQEHHKTSFAAMKRGRDAISFMGALQPAMSRRRQEQIQRCLDDFQPRQYKLSMQQAREIRNTFQEQEITKYRLAEQYGVDEKLIREIIKGNYYREHRDVPTPFSYLPSLGSANFMDFTWWLAGWLEGEGCFSHSHNSNKSLCIDASSTDMDTIEQVHRRIGGSFSRIRPRKAHWSEAWHWQIGTRKAQAVAQAITGVLSQRRQSRIQSLINVPATSWNANCTTTPYIDWLSGQKPLTFDGED